MSTIAPPFDENEPEKPQYSLNNLPVLTDEQKALIDADDNWKMEIGALAKLVTEDENQDGRSFWGKAIKLYLAGQGKEIKTSKKVIKGELELTDEQKAFIQANHKQMKAREMMNLLFQTESTVKLTTLGREFRAVYKYAKDLDDSEVDMFDEPVESQEYIPPMSIGSLIGRVNQFVSNPVDHTRKMFDPNKLKPHEDKNLRALIGFLKTVRFRQQASSYKKYADRELFESTFIRFVYDKACEITAGEVDLYMVAAVKTIATARLERSIEGLQEKVDSALAGEDDKDGNKAKLSHGLVTLINESHGRVNQYTTQLKSLIDDLDGKRKDRIDGRNSRNSSILGLFEAVKNEDERENALATGDKEKEEDGEVVKKIKGMEHILGLVAGHTEEEASFG